VSEMMSIKGECFDRKPAFTLKTQSDEMKALLVMCRDENMAIVDVGDGEFFIHVIGDGES
jgi:hypothetical protein